MATKDLSPGIKLFFESGNCFIMDSESLVSNVYHESQQEVIGEVWRKNSITEKLTSVRNNLYERRYAKTLTFLEGERNRRLKELLENSNLLRDEGKLLDLDRQRHDIEVKKRMFPGRDFRYYNNQLRNQERRLGVTTAPCYLNKRQRFPVRLRSANDISPTPTIRRARASLRQHDLQRSKEGVHLDVPVDAHRTRVNFISHPVARPEHHQNEVILPSVCRMSTDKRNMQRAHTSYITNSHPTTLVDKNDSLSYKISVDELPLKTLQSPWRQSKITPKGLISQNELSYISDMDNLSDEDDNHLLPDYVNLRDHFFSNLKTKTEDSRHFCKNQQILKSKIPQRAVTFHTTDNIRAEAEHIRVKIKNFMTDFSGSHTQNEETAELTEVQQESLTKLDTQGICDKATSTNSTINKSRHSPVDYSIQMMPSTAIHQVDHATINIFNYAKRENMEMPNQPSQRSSQAGPSLVEVDTAEGSTKPSHITPKKIRYSWKHIQGRSADGNLRGTYSAEDLVLQKLTGIPIRNVMQTPVPLHAAARATRHTATYKMHKIVENMIKERTRYQRYVVEELKKKMIDELKGETVAESEHNTTTQTNSPP